jgi:hypothetical protein
MSRNNHSIKNLLILFLIILLSFLFLSCHKVSTQPATLELNAPSLNGTNYSSIYSSFAAIQIPIKITNDSGFNYQAALQTGSNNIQIPSGTIHVKVGFLALGLNAATPTVCAASGSNNNNNNNNNSGQQSVLYTELDSDFSVDSTTTTISINFPSPFAIINFDHFGFMITTASGAQATNAQISFFDPISGLPLTDPCTKVAFNATADSQGRVAQDLPVYSNSLQFGFNVVASDGSTQKFLPTLVRGSTNAQFYYLPMANGNVTAINQQTVSFIGDGYTIAQRRDTLQKNPRFPDLPAPYTFTAPNSTTGFVNLYPNLGTTQPNDLINSRKITIMCQILNYQNTVILAPFQACNGNIPSIFTYPITLMYGDGYYLSAYLIDSENFYPSNTTAAAPANLNFTDGNL